MEKFIVANWKMNKGSLEDLPFLESVAQINVGPTVTAIIAPPYTLLQAAQKALESTPFHLGAQDCSTQGNGAHTGDVSAYMLKMCGCTSVIVGHSERRQNHNETSEIVRKKAEISGENGLIPIICVGETAEEYQAKKTFDIIDQQIEFSSPRKDFPFLIAYEPVWAIGTGKVPSLEEINHVHETIKKSFKNPKKVLYGGSVNPENAKEILSLPSVDGLLIGGASLEAEKLKNIIDAASCL
ncbi:triose-phosphate isomerase [Alphaproteobacteria bacterium]|nr:triose-phosphate isomerase [Alphaproteobacteria bacterium]